MTDDGSSDDQLRQRGLELQAHAPRAVGVGSKAAEPEEAIRGRSRRARLALMYSNERYFYGDTFYVDVRD